MIERPHWIIIRTADTILVNSHTSHHKNELDAEIEQHGKHGLPNQPSSTGSWLEAYMTCGDVIAIHHRDGKGHFDDKKHSSFNTLRNASER